MTREYFDLRDFIVAPPLGAKFDEEAVRAKILAVLGERHSDCTFRMVDDSGDRVDRFVIMPSSKDQRQKLAEAHQIAEEELSVSEPTMMSRILAGSVMSEMEDFLDDRFGGAE